MPCRREHRKGMRFWGEPHTQHGLNVGLLSPILPTSSRSSVEQPQHLTRQRPKSGERLKQLFAYLHLDEGDDVSAWQKGEGGVAAACSSRSPTSASSTSAASSKPSSSHPLHATGRHQQAADRQAQAGSMPTSSTPQCNPPTTTSGTQSLQAQAVSRYQPRPGQQQAAADSKPTSTYSVPRAGEKPPLSYYYYKDPTTPTPRPTDGLCGVPGGLGCGLGGGPGSSGGFGSIVLRASSSSLSGCGEGPRAAAAARMMPSFTPTTSMFRSSMLISSPR